RALGRAVGHRRLCRQRRRRAARLGAREPGGAGSHRAQQTDRRAAEMTMMKKKKTVFVTGGAGYVGAVLVPKLLRAGYRVKVFDLYIYGRDVLDEVKGHPDLVQIEGDIRDAAALKTHLSGADAVIHLACISNDPSFELAPALSRSINFEA